MKALFRIPVGKGRFIAVFFNAIIVEYYDTNNSMVNARRIIG